MEWWWLPMEFVSFGYANWKAKQVKIEVKGWVKARAVIDKKTLKGIELKIGSFFALTNPEAWIQSDKDLLLSLEKEKASIL